MNCFSRPTRAQALAGVLWVTLAAHAFAAPGAHGPDGQHLDAPGGGGTGTGLARMPDGSANIPKSAQRQMEIRTSIARESQAAVTLELPGRVVLDPNASGSVQSVHGGRLEPGARGLPVPGQAVRKGEVMAYLRHHAEPFATGQQQSQLADLRAEKLIAEQRVKRLESLEGTVPRKEIESARVQLESLALKERSIGNSLSAREVLVAPVTGVVARTSAAVGKVFEPRDVLFEIVDPKRMLIEATTVDPSLSAKISAAHVANMPGVRLRIVGGARIFRDGVLTLVFSAASGAKEDLPLAVGQPITVLASTKEQVKGFVLPAEAVVRNAANQQVVWIKSGAERYIPQPVQFQSIDSSRVVVTSGLGADNRVVVRGASLISQIR